MIATTVQFNVSKLLREPVGSRRHHPVDEHRLSVPNETPPISLDGSANLLRTDLGVLAVARLTSRMVGECARCLAGVSYPVALEVEEEYVPTVDPVTGARLIVPVDASFTIDGHHILDLTDAVIQAWTLAQPMQILCREQCRGLCPDCGADRNLGPCICQDQIVDSRWASLATLHATIVEPE